MRIIRYIAFGAAAVAALVLLAQPVQASCADAAIISTVDDNFDPPQRTHIWTEGYFTPSYYPGQNPPTQPYSTAGPPYSPNFDAVWWEMGRSAANNGSNDSANWIYYRIANFGGTDYFYAAELFGGWGEGGVNDCVADGACTCVMMTDSVNNQGYFAITGNNNVGATRTTLLRQASLDPAGNATPIVLRPIPESFIVLSERVGQDLIVTVNSPPPVGADYQLGTCDCLNSYFVMSQVSDVPPTDRDAALWTRVPGQPADGTPFGTEVAVTLTCGGTENIYLATQVAGNDGVDSNVVSGNSTRIECDPNLVDDQVLPREPRQRNPRQGRQGR